MGETASAAPRPRLDVGLFTENTAGRGSQDSRNSTRILLFLLLLLVVGVVLTASIVFSDNSRVFLLKFMVAALLAFIPGWIYLQFLRDKGPSLYDEYVLNLFRLKIDAIENLPAPPQHTNYHKIWAQAHQVIPAGVTDNLYRRKFESVYGPSAVSTIALIKRGDQLTLKERTETFGPVIMATTVMALGWALVLQPELLGAIDLLGTGFILSGQPILPAEPLRFGFLGAYAFIILDLSRRYFRDDLRSAAYLSTTTRIVFTSALLVAAHAALPAAVEGYQQQANLIAFFIGFFPRAGFTWLRAALPRGLQAAVPQLESDYPLRDLEGVSVWYESRLLEEGIESLQNLCSASLVDLMVRTRIPVVRLIDWLDQAYLILHLPKGPQHPEQPPPAVRELRALGIRTATDLERAWQQHDRPEGLGPLLGQALKPGDPDSVEALMSTLLHAFRGQPNLWHVRAFRELRWLCTDEGAGQQSLPANVNVTTTGSVTPTPSPAPDRSPLNGHRTRERTKRRVQA